MSTTSGAVYGRLSVFYFFYFAALGVLIPFWGLYLLSLDFSAREIGELLAVLVGTKLVAPYIWGLIADYSGRRVRVIQIGSFMAAASFLLVYYVESYWFMAGVMVLYSFFWNAVIPQYDVVTMNHLGKSHRRYGLIRSWGSIGFIIAVILAGALVDQYQGRIILPVLTFVFFAIWLSAMLTPEDRYYAIGKGDSAEKIAQIIRRPEVIALFLVCFLMQFSHGAYYAFFSIHLEHYGYSKTVIGQYWALGVLAEIIIFLIMAKLLNRYGAKKLVITSLIIASVRWILTAYFADSWWIMAISQTMHAATFGLYHAVAIYYVYHYFTGKLQGRGQALYNSLGFGAGGALGSLISGYGWEAMGATATYLIASSSTAVAVVISIALMKDIKPAYD